TGDDGQNDSYAFYRTISLRSAVEFGGVIDPETVIWWFKQSDAARQPLIDAETEIELALYDLAHWIVDLEPDGIWGNGAAFDNAILAAAYRKADLPHFQWSHKMDRCYRTERAMSDVKMEPRTGTHHNALDDAYNQARHLIAIWKSRKAA
ncbi:MAG: 3'-5' exoribonuclease, partial [Cellvibrionaceae bacterium]|nr:3'-5' exoribonuclease [Cellvibrionaceae bacterium]